MSPARPLLIHIREPTRDCRALPYITTTYKHSYKLFFITYLTGYPCGYRRALRRRAARKRRGPSAIELLSRIRRAAVPRGPACASPHREFLIAHVMHALCVKTFIRSFVRESRNPSVQCECTRGRDVNRYLTELRARSTEQRSAVKSEEEHEQICD